MKILQVCRQFFPSTGGLESVTYGLSQALKHLGHRCDIVTLNRLFGTGQRIDSHAVIDGLQVYRLPYIGSNRYPLAPTILSFVAPYDVIHIHGIDFFVDFLSITQPIHRKPLLVSTHGGIFHTRWLYPVKQLYFRTATQLSLQRAHRIVCVSSHDYDLFRQILPTDKLRVIPNGIHLRPLLTIQKRIQPELLIGIGRIFENKNIDQLIRILPDLVAEFPNIQIVWIGPDQQQRGPDLMALAQKQGVADHIRFVGHISDEEMRSWLAQAHLFVACSTYEAFGIATLEAMGSATVPVVTPVGIHPDVVRDGETGFVFPFDDHHALSAIKHALRLPPEKLQQIGENARRTVTAFSWDTIATEYLALYGAAVR